MGEEVPQSAPVAAVPWRLRLWPAIVLVVVLWAMRIAASMGEVSPGKFFFGLIVTPLAVILGLILWTLFASRLQWRDGLLISGVLAAVTGITIVVAGDNFPVMALIMHVVPILSTAWIGWLLISMWLNWPVRRAVLLAMFVVAGIACSTLRLDGMDGEFASTFNWRWTPTPEQRLLEELKNPRNIAKASAPSEEARLTEHPGDWPAFRGAARDGRLTGVTIKTDWNKTPPSELWRHRIGPGWSSVTVIGNHLFTQEQRGDDEYVVCYDATSGQEMWTHHDATRFFEVVAGPGPRATPTFHEGKLYVQGANGTVNCLDAASGKKIWSKNLVADTGAKIPQWGFSSSPLISHGVVSVFAGGKDGKSMVAYRADTGELAWTSGEGTLSYCSPQLASIDGKDQILITTDAGISSYDPTSGKVLWSHEWLAKDMARIVQPAVIDGHDVLIGSGMGVGTRRINVSHDGQTWSVKERWTTRDIKPYYNDLVVAGDYLYGFDGNIFMCVSLKDGSRKWRARGYGNGQVLLIADQALLLIVSEQGEVALVKAEPDAHNEVARFKAIEGKTWNHPVIACGKLFVRNAEEIACFKLDIEDALQETGKGADQTTDGPVEPK